MRHLGTVCKKIAISAVQTAVILIGITLVTFFILHISPVNPAEIYLMGNSGNVGQVSQEAIEEQEKKMGLDKPFIVQYASWLNNVAHGDLGKSMTTSKPVKDEIAEHAVPTAVLTAVSLLITVLISVPLGIYCAVKKDRALDNIVRIFSFLGISMPSFFISLVLLWIFCLKLQVLPVIAQRSPKGMILPAAVLIIQCSSKYIRQVRAVVLEQLNQEYVMGAAARGVSERDILFKHVLKNSAVPILTWCGMYFGIMLGGASVIETIFSWDGLGKLAVESVTTLDYYMIQGFVLWTAVVFLIVNFAVDVAGDIIDPRVKRGRI